MTLLAPYDSLTKNAQLSVVYKFKMVKTHSKFTPPGSVSDSWVLELHVRSLGLLERIQLTQGELKLICRDSPTTAAGAR